MPEKHMTEKPEIEKTDHEVIGEEPDRETYEIYEVSGKLMELSFYENSNQFRIYVRNREGGKKVEGETTKLFRLMVEKIQAKTNELQLPVKLILDPVVPVMKTWVETKAAEVLGEWDEVGEGRFVKTFFPET